MVNKRGNRVKITWSIDADLIKKVKHEAIDLEKDASSIVEDAIREWFDRKSSKTVLAAKKAWETRREKAKNG